MIVRLNRSLCLPIRVSHWPGLSSLSAGMAEGISHHRLLLRFGSRHQRIWRWYAWLGLKYIPLLSLCLIFSDVVPGGSPFLRQHYWCDPYSGLVAFQSPAGVSRLEYGPPEVH